MAIDFGSHQKTFENYKVYETMLAGRPFKVEMGKMCGLSNESAATVIVMCNVVSPPCPTSPERPHRRPASPAAALCAVCAR